MSDDDPPFQPCHSYSTHSPPCRCCYDHRRRIRQLLAELNAMRSTAAKSMAIMTERVISDAILEPRALSCEEDPIAASEGAAAVCALSKYAKYPFKVDENIKALDSAVSELKAMKNDVLRVKESTDSTNHIFPSSTVQDWLIKVNMVIEEADAIDQKYKERHRIIYVVCSDYSISQHAAKKLPEVKSLIANEVIRSVITGTHSPAASPQPAGVEFNVNGRKYDFSVHLGTK